MLHKASILACLLLAACDGAAMNTPASGPRDGAADSGAGLAATDAVCSFSPDQGAVCNGGQNEPGLTATSVNNEGLVGNSTSGRGVYGSSIGLEGGYFSSTNGDGLLAYTVNGYAAHFTGGRGVVIDAPGVAGSCALTANGPVEASLPAAASGVIPVCGTLDTATGLYTLTKCDDRLDKLEAQVAALMARLGLSADAGTD